MPTPQPRLRALAAALGDETRDRRFVDYRQAEEDCAALGEKLLAAYPRRELAAFRFAPIPRGGLFVLGMLSYVLDLDGHQLAPGGESGQPLVVVDDCALTGARFTRFLAGAGAERAVFAHLYSHPELRRRLGEREPRLEACIAARDLEERQRRTDAEARRHRQRWQRRLGPDARWAGDLRPIAFAWSEPDQPFWNPETEQVEDVWRLAPADRCLKNRVRLGLPPRPAPRRRWRQPEGVAVGRFDGELWLCDAAGDQVYRLAGTSADCWSALVAYGDEMLASEVLAERYDVPEPLLLDDLAAFARQCAACGLLEYRGGGDAKTGREECNGGGG